MRHVVLPLHVIAQDARKSVKLRLKLAYGVCEKLCVPVEMRAEIPLTGGPTAHDVALAAAEARVPKPATLGDGKFAIRTVRQEPTLPPPAPRPRVVVEVAAPDAAKVDLFAEGPTADWALPLPEPIASEPGVRRFAFELDGLPAGAKAAGAILKLTAVAGEEAIEVPIRLD
jgi:DsbC/DsbD-like thiol-disulfide interchange protein